MTNDLSSALVLLARLFFFSSGSSDFFFFFYFYLNQCSSERHETPRRSKPCSPGLHTTTFEPHTHICDTHPNPSALSLRGPEMEHVRCFWHLYSEIILQIVLFSFKWRLLFFFAKKWKCTLRKLLEERFQTEECAEPVVLLLHMLFYLFSSLELI